MLKLLLSVVLVQDAAFPGNFIFDGSGLQAFISKNNKQFTSLRALIHICHSVVLCRRCILRPQRRRPSGPKRRPRGRAAPRQLWQWRKARKACARSPTPTRKCGRPWRSSHQQLPAMQTSGAWRTDNPIYNDAVALLCPLKLFSAAFSRAKRVPLFWKACRQSSSEPHFTVYAVQLSWHCTAINSRQ